MDKYTPEQAAEFAGIVLGAADVSAVNMPELAAHAPKELSVEDGAAPVGITEGKERSDTGVAGELCHRQFEIYAASQGHKDFEQNEFGNYKNPAVQGDYWIWIASREAMASQNGDGEFCTVINDDKSKCQRENRHCGYPSCIASQPHPNVPSERLNPSGIGDTK